MQIGKHITKCSITNQFALRGYVLKFGTREALRLTSDVSPKVSLEWSQKLV